jgi:hypothetical protein
MGKVNGIWLTEKKLEEMDACYSGRRVFARYAKGRKRVLVNEQTVQAFLNARPSWERDGYVRFLLGSLRLAGTFHFSDGSLAVYDGAYHTAVYSRTAGGSGGVLVDGNWFFFGAECYGTHPDYYPPYKCTAKKLESYDAAVRFARQRRQAARAGVVSGQPTTS